MYVGIGNVLSMVPGDDHQKTVLTNRLVLEGLLLTVSL